MKKILIITMVFLCLIPFVGCGKKPQAHFTAEVITVNDTNILAMVTDKGSSGATADSEVYITKNVTEGNCPDLYAGDIVKVYFNGEVMETYPLKLGEVYSIEKLQSAPTPDCGVELTVENITSDGLTIVCSQSGGSAEGELMTGSYYVVEVQKGDKWEEIPILIENLAWTAEAWIIPMNDTVRWDVNWSLIYGELSKGHYRIGKEIMNFKGTGNYDKAMLYAEFDI